MGAEKHLQKEWYIPFFTVHTNGLNYNRVQANQVNPENHIIVSDLIGFLRDTDFNRESYFDALNNVYMGDEDKFQKEIIDELYQKYLSASNVAVFFNNNKTFTFKGYSFILFALGNSEMYGDTHFEQNIFSAVEELTFSGKRQHALSNFTFRPDICFFVNGFLFSYIELKCTKSGQNALENGRNKIKTDFLEASKDYLRLAENNDVDRTLQRKLLLPFEKVVNILSLDEGSCYVLRNLSFYFENYIRPYYNENKYSNFEEYHREVLKFFKPYPLNPKTAKSKDITVKIVEVLKALFSKKMVEKEILYYNFLKYNYVRNEKTHKKEMVNHFGSLITPRPKQKFGVDKVIARIPELVEHEKEPNYFLDKYRQELIKAGVEASRAEQLVKDRDKLKNNKNIYSILLQYAAGFGKSNIIGWLALQLKDLRDQFREYVFDKIFLVVDRVQLRDQLDTMLHNMNINKGMFVEVRNKDGFKKALTQKEKIIVINIQKFNALSPKPNANPDEDSDITKEFLDEDTLNKLKTLRVAFLIDEIHRSNSGTQHDEMVSLFDQLQSAFDHSEDYVKNKQKKNLLIGLTATPSKLVLERFGEFSHYAENRPLFVPFDCYTMSEAIEDGYIIDPTKNILPVDTKMYYTISEDQTKKLNIKDVAALLAQNPDDEEANQKVYSFRKQLIYDNEDRMKAICKKIVRHLTSFVYPKIKGKAKAMLAVSSIPMAIKYFKELNTIYPQYIEETGSKYDRYKDAPIYIVYSDSQEYESCASLNNGQGEEKVLKEFRSQNNALIIVVSKLQTGFDEPTLHTLYLDKEIRGINAIQTISRVDRTCKNKKDCAIVDFSHLNLNVSNIQKAFRQFSGMVVSEFDPIQKNKELEKIYGQLANSEIYRDCIKDFKANHLSYDVHQAIVSFITCETENEKTATLLFEKAMEFFTIYHYLFYIVDLSQKVMDKDFYDFWVLYCRLYLDIYRKEKPKTEEIQVFFDDVIGELVPEYVDEQPTGPKAPKAKKSKTRKYNILEELEKMNELEEKIEEKIAQMTLVIDQMFAWIKNKDPKLIIMIQRKDNTFSLEQKQGSFNRNVNKYLLGVGSELDDNYKVLINNNLPSLFEEFEDFVNGVNRI